jgi:hypothetical protein
MKVPQQLGRQVRVCVSPVFTKSQVAGIIRLIINEEDDDPMCVCVFQFPRLKFTVGKLN